MTDTRKKEGPRRRGDKISEQMKLKLRLSLPRDQLLLASLLLSPQVVSRTFLRFKLTCF